MRDIIIKYGKFKTTELTTPHGQQECFVLLREGAKIDIDGIEYTTGGGATNAAVSFKRLGFDAAACCKVGQDLEGQTVVDQLQRDGITTDLIIKSTEHQTGTSFIIPCPSGDRTVLVYRGANITLQESELPAIAHYDQLYISSLGGPTAQLLLPIAKQAKKNNIPVATNPGTSQLTVGVDTLYDALPHIDILILNAYEASLLAYSLAMKKKLTIQQKITTENNAPTLLQNGLAYKDFLCSLPDYLTHILKSGPRIAVVTNGAEGVYVATQNTLYFHPSLPTKVVSTLGAGDAFASCFVAMLAQQQSIGQALVCGIINSSSVIGFLGAKTGLLTATELANRFKTVGTGKVQSYDLGS